MASVRGPKESWWKATAKRVQRHPTITALFLAASVGQLSMVLQFNSHILIDIGNTPAGAFEAAGILLIFVFIFPLIIPYFLWIWVCKAFD